MIQQANDHDASFSLYSQICDFTILRLVCKWNSESDAVEGLERCRRFLAVKASEAAKRAGQAIDRQFLLLERTPDMGRPFAEQPDLRELLIAFGDSGYIALYRHEPAQDAVYVLAFRHQQEAGF